MPKKPLEPYQLKYNPGPETMKYMKDRISRATLQIGPFGTGKTTAAGFKKIMLQSQWVKPGKDGIARSKFAVVRNTYGQLRDSTIKTYLEWFPPGEFGGRYLETHKEATYRLGNPDRLVTLMFRALDDESDVRNLLSTEYTGAHLDEAREIKQSIFKGIMGRCKRYPSRRDYDGEMPFLLFDEGGKIDTAGFTEEDFEKLLERINIPACAVDLTTNYPNRDHWLYKDFVSKPIPGYRIFVHTQEENKHNLPPRYYEDLALDYADRPDLLRTLVIGDWGITYNGKLVYPEWNHQYFVSPLPIKYEDRLFIRGWDNTGLHPGCVITQINSEMQWCILKEFWHEDMGITDFCEWVYLWCRENLHGAEFEDYCDPAGKNRDPNKISPKEYMQTYFKSVGQQFYPWEGIQTFKVRRESVASRLIIKRTRPMMLVDPSCTMVIDGFEGGYCFPEIGNTGIYKDQPTKNKYADIHDALQYPATRLFMPNQDNRDDSDEYEEEEQGRSAYGGY